MPPLKALAAAADILGNQSELARALDCDPSLVSRWLSGNRKPAPQYAKEIERLTGGQIRREWIRPDIFG